MNTNASIRCTICGQWWDGALHSCGGSPTFPAIPQWPAPQGWQCPNCGSAHAPHVLTCPVQVPTGTTYGPANSSGGTEQ